MEVVTTIEMELAGVRYKLDPAAISALRYRAEYGESIINHLAACRDVREEEARLLRVCWMMIPTADRPELRTFAQAARRDGRFVAKARRAVDALLDVDPRAPRSDEPPEDDLDEYAVVAAMAAAGMDTALVCELPILHLAGIAARRFEMDDPDKKSYRRMTREERSALYPRRKKGGAAARGGAG